MANTRDKAANSSRWSSNNGRLTIAVSVRVNLVSCLADTLRTLGPRTKGETGTKWRLGRLNIRIWVDEKERHDGYLAVLVDTRTSGYERISILQALRSR
jgi:hypothetical protein